MDASAAELAELCEELQALRGCFVDKLWVPGPSHLVLRLSRAGLRADLLLSCAPGAGGLWVVGERPRGPAGAMQAKFRAAVQGSRLFGIRQPEAAERVVFLEFGRRQSAHLLVLELLGPRANLLLIELPTPVDGAAFQDQERSLGSRRRELTLAEGRIRSALHPEVLGRRGLSLGAAYQAPAPRPALVRERADVAAAGAAGSEGAGDSDTTSRTNGIAQPAASPAFPLSLRFETRTQSAQKVDAFASEMQALGTRIRKALSKGRRKQAKIEVDLERAAQANFFQEQGELLKASLHQVRRGQSEVEVADWYGVEGSTRLIQLQASKTPTENMESLFKQAHRRRRAGEIGRVRLESISQQLLKLEALRDQLMALEESAGSEEGDPDSAAEAIQALAARAGLLLGPGAGAAASSPQKRAGPQRRKVYRSFVAPEGHRVLVGRSAKDNHQLSFRVARGRDLWFHVRDYPGSHVVLPLERGEEATERARIDAGLLAAHFSEARGQELVELQWTLRKHLRHPPGAAPGLVSVAQGRGLRVRADPERLRRLFDGEDRG